jgi:carboxymethylenebutenolidase
MSNRFAGVRYVPAALLAACLLVTGCDSSDDAASDNNSQATTEKDDTAAAESAARAAEVGQDAQIAPQKAVISERLPYAEVGDELVYGHFVFPADMIDPLPAIIVIHDLWGLNDNVKAMSERLAAEDFIVLAVDLYSGDIVTGAGEARERMIRVVENPDRASDNIRQAYEFVDTVAGAPAIGSLGWGFGGGWSLNTAMLFPDDLDAAVIYYGQVTGDDDELRALNVPILGLFGEMDRSVPVANVRAFEEALARLRKDFDVSIYPNTNGDFANPTGNSYDREAAEDAWQKTLSFLGRTLIETAE